MKPTAQTEKPKQALLTRMQPGMIVELEQRKHVIVMVNDCRARALPLEKETRKCTPQTGAEAGKVKEIESTGKGHNISPDALCPILEWGGAEAGAERLAKFQRGGFKAERSAAQPKVKAPKAERKGPSKCAFIDAMLTVPKATSKGKHTKEQVLAAVLKAFPGSDEKSTASTINARPSHIRKAGKFAAFKS